MVAGRPGTEWPARVVAAKGVWWDFRRGMRKVEVQPAPRIRRSMGEAGDGGARGGL